MIDSHNPTELDNEPNFYREDGEDGRWMCSTCESEVFGGICDCYTDNPTLRKRIHDTLVDHHSIVTYELGEKLEVALVKLVADEVAKNLERVTTTSLMLEENSVRGRATAGNAVRTVESSSSTINGTLVQLRHRRYTLGI